MKGYMNLYEAQNIIANARESVANMKIDSPAEIFGKSSPKFSKEYELGKQSVHTVMCEYGHTPSTLEAYEYFNKVGVCPICESIREYNAYSLGE